jgi:competence protein ComEA
MLDAADAARSEPPLSTLDDAGALALTPAVADATVREPPGNNVLPEPPSAEPASGATWWLTDRDILVFVVLSAVLLVLLAFRWASLSGWGVHEIDIERQSPLTYNFHLDPNTASWVELAQLDGVGETLAVRIVEDREANGPFHTLEELDRVKGIGAKTIERLRPFLHVAPIDHPN